MKLGFIGTGSMGSILIEAFISSEAVRAEDIWANNRTRSKAEKLQQKHPKINIAESNLEVVLKCDVIFLCIKPHEYRTVIDNIKDVLLPEQIVISITSPVLVRHLEELLPCKIAKIIPSITNFTCSGPTLCIFGKRMTKKNIQQLKSLLEPISQPIEIPEQFTRVASDITSCGPAFLSYFVQQFIEAAHRETGMCKAEASRLASEMVLGTGILLTSGGFTPETLQERVRVPGGITAEGLRLMSDELDGLFHRLIRQTHKKYHHELNKVEAMFYTTR